MPVSNLYLRVNQRLLLLPNLPTEDQANPLPSPAPPCATGNLNIIAAELPDLQKFAGNTVDWLLRVARLLLDPRGVGVLHTFQMGTVRRWLDREMDGSWRQVKAGERLVPTIYEYRRLDGYGTYEDLCLRRQSEIRVHISHSARSKGVSQCTSCSRPAVYCFTIVAT